MNTDEHGAARPQPKRIYVHLWFHFFRLGAFGEKREARHHVTPNSQMVFHSLLPLAPPRCVWLSDLEEGEPSKSDNAFESSLRPRPGSFGSVASPERGPGNDRYSPRRSIELLRISREIDAKPRPARRKGCPVRERRGASALDPAFPRQHVHGELPDSASGAQRGRVCSG